jgi:LysR family transcriptional regulator, glycine cleavage system transcriptional activator
METAMIRLPPLNALKCFEAAARSGSFSKAADELHVTQSAVSHQIRQLEEHFGFPLFDRQGRQTVPTLRGRELAEALSEAFGIMASACKRAQQANSRPSLTIAALPSVATIWLIPRLSDFFRDHPEIGVKVMYAFHGAPIDFTDNDVAILYGAGHWQDAIVTPFLDGTSIAVASKSFLEKHGPFDKPETLLAAPLIHDTKIAGWQRWFRTAGLGSIDLPPGPIFEDFNLLRSAVLAGTGAALCPASLIDGDIEAGRLVRLSDATQKEENAYYVLEPENPEPARGKAIQLFKQWLFANRPAGDNLILSQK